MVLPRINLTELYLINIAWVTDMKFDVTILKQMRKEAGLTQAEIAKSIGISRETVVAIENAHPNTLEALSANTLGYWLNICRTGEKEPTQKQLENNRLKESTDLLFKSAILQKYGY